MKILWSNASPPKGFLDVMFHDTSGSCVKSFLYMKVTMIESELQWKRFLIQLNLHSEMADLLWRGLLYRVVRAFSFLTKRASWFARFLGDREISQPSTTKFNKEPWLIVFVAIAHYLAAVPYLPADEKTHTTTVYQVYWFCAVSSWLTGFMCRNLDPWCWFDRWCIRNVDDPSYSA